MNIRINSSVGAFQGLSKQTTIEAMFIFDYSVLRVTKLSKTFQSEHLILSDISNLVDKPSILDDTASPELINVVAYVQLSMELCIVDQSIIFCTKA